MTSVNGRAGATHRPYQNAILEMLADGKPHHKEDLKMAGIRACEAFDSIGAWQRAHPEDEAALNAMGGPERADEAMRQQVEGAKMLVGKSMSHLVDRKLMEVAGLDDKGKRAYYRITERGREFLKNPPTQAPMMANRRASKYGVQKCFFCGQDADTSEPTVYRYGMVWFKNSGGGGINQGRLVGEPLRFAHKDCLLQNIDRDQPIHVDQIMAAVAARFGLTPDNIFEKNYTKEVVLARQIAYYLVRELIAGRSRKRLAEVFGRVGDTPAHGARVLKQRLADEESVEIDGERVSIQHLVDEIRASALGA